MSIACAQDCTALDTLNQSGDLTGQSLVLQLFAQALQTIDVKMWQP
jgi:hypothetical protein